MTFEENNGAKILTPQDGQTVRIISDFHAGIKPFAEATQIALGQLNNSGQIIPEGFPGNLQQMIPYIQSWIPPNRVGTENFVDHVIEAGDGISGYPPARKEESRLDQGFRNLLEIMRISGINGKDRTFMPGNHTPFNIMPSELVSYLDNSGMAAEKVKIQLGNGSIASVRHGHEFDPRDSGDRSGFNNPVYTWLDGIWQMARRVMNLNRLPYNDPIVNALTTVMNAHHIARATTGLKSGDMAFDGHTHFATLIYDICQSSELIDPKNVLSTENILGLIRGHPMAQVIFLALRKLLPKVSGAGLIVPNEIGRRYYGNTGYRDANGIQTAIDLQIGQQVKLITMDINQMLGNQIWRVDDQAIEMQYQISLNQDETLQKAMDPGLIEV